MPGKYISREKENFFKRLLKGWGFWLVGCFMSFIVCSTMLVLMRGVLLLKIFVAFCTTVITLGLYFNWAYNCAKRDRNAVKYHNMEYDKFMPLKMAVGAPIVSYVMLIMLYLCKAGTVPDTFFSAYILADIWILPYITLFTGERTIYAMSWAGIGGMTLITLLQPLTVYLTYVITYNDVDIVSLIFYNKKK